MAPHPVAWEECPDCDEFICNIHQEHVHDCSCPGIETWVEHDLNPYTAPVTPTLTKWAEEHPFLEE